MWPPPHHGGFPPFGGHPPQGGRPRRTRESYMVLMLLAEVWRQLGQLEHKPPVTAALLAANIGVYVVPDLFPASRSPEAVCLHPARILEGALHGGGGPEWLVRLLLSALVHADDYHLYYNMTSLLWKGVNLETAMGSEAFVWLVVWSWVVSHGLFVLLALLLLHTGVSPGSFHSCAVGFSAVLFSLKYVLNSSAPGSTPVFGFEVPTRLACWAELVLISFVTPNASFLGHLCGILAGVLWVHGHKALPALRDAARAAGIHIPHTPDRPHPPAAAATGAAAGGEGGAAGWGWGVGGAARRPTRYTYQRGTWGAPQAQPRQPAAARAEDEDEDEAVREALRRSLHQTRAPAPGGNTSRPHGARGEQPDGAGGDDDEEERRVQEMLRRSAEEQRFQPTAASTTSSSSSSREPPRQHPPPTEGRAGGTGQGPISREEVLRRRIARLDPNSRQQQ